MCDLFPINVNKSKLITVKIVIILCTKQFAFFVPTFRRNVISWFQYVLMCGQRNVFGSMWWFEVIWPQIFIIGRFYFCHQFTVHLHQFTHSDDGVSTFLRNTGTCKECYVLQEHKHWLLFAHHPPCKCEDLLRLRNSLSSCIKKNRKKPII